MKFNNLIPELSVSDNFAFLSFGDAQIMIEEINGYWNTGELRYPFAEG